MGLLTTQVDELTHERRVLLDRLATLGLGGPLFSSASSDDSSESAPRHRLTRKQRRLRA